MGIVAVKRALFSLTIKDGAAEFARGMYEAFGTELLSTGGTAKALSESGLPVTLVEQVTGWPEMMEGRVKTLHPKVHGALLADRAKPEHLAQAQQHGIALIDMAVVNLYQFAKTVADPNVAYGVAIENIDIGGPAMIRSSAKNHASVVVVVDPADYGLVLAEMRANHGGVTEELRIVLATKAFAYTERYEATIGAYMRRHNAALLAKYPQIKLP